MGEAMKPRELFGLAVRVLGLWFLTQSFYYFLLAALKANDPHVLTRGISPHEDMAYGIPFLVLSALLLLCADPIVWIVYGLPPKLTLPEAADTPHTNAKPDNEPPP